MALLAKLLTCPFPPVAPRDVESRAAPVSHFDEWTKPMTTICVDVERPGSRVRLRDRFQPARAPGASLSRASARPVISLGKATHEVDEVDAEVWLLCDG